jgi:hypothetical protein
MGTLVLCYAILFTHENPIIVGLAHTALLYIASAFELENHFTPLSVIVELMLGRLSIIDSLQLFGLQLVAVLCIVFVYKQRFIL